MSIPFQYLSFEANTCADSSPDTSTAAECTPVVPWNHDQVEATDANLQHEVANTGQVKSRANSRRQLERDLFLAARNRRRAAADSYYHNPPTPEEIWICEFCEYERIFGRPPSALIRQYEMKDRKLRQEEADRRRLLEKAKAKSRKARKGTKGAKGTQSATQSPQEGSADQAATEATPMELNHSHSTRSDGEYEDVFDDHRPRDPPDILGLYEQQPVARGESTSEV